MDLPDEKLIAEVKARPPLYDKELAEYAQMDRRMEMWKEVATAVDADVDTCRKRWRSLRDVFLKNYRAVKDFPNGTATRRKKMWSYFDSMFFLVPHVEHDETVKDVATKYIETAEQISCSSNDITEQTESQNPLVIESICSVSPECTTENIFETSQDPSEFEDSSGDETYCDLGDTLPEDHDYTEALKKRKQPDEAYKKFLMSLEYDKNTEISVENFISEIKARPLLYAKGLTDNRKHPKRLALWKEVADATCLDVVSCRKRWRSLRDVFNKNYRCLIDCPADIKKKMWPYFQKMFFLAPHLEDKETFQYAATKYSHLWQNTKQDSYLSDDTSTTFPPESGDSSENIKGTVNDKGTSGENNTSLGFYDTAKFYLLAKKSVKTSEFSDEKLIAAVKLRPKLYTRGSGGSSQQNKRLMEWSEVAAAVGEDAQTCKKRWKSLRDTFIKHYRFAMKTRNNVPNAKKKIWIHYKKLLFLIPYLEHRDTINDKKIEMNQPASDNTSAKINQNTQLANTSLFLIPVSNIESRPLSNNALKLADSHIQHNKSSESLVTPIKKENISSFPNGNTEQKNSGNQYHNLRTCLVSLKRIPEIAPHLSMDTSETPQTQLDNTRKFPVSQKNSTENDITLFEDTAVISKLKTRVDNVNLVPVAIKNISPKVLETSQSQPESPINTPVNEKPSNCFPANENPSNLGNTRSRGPRGSYKSSVKRKFGDVTKGKISSILPQEDDPDKQFLLSLLPSLKRMTPRQNALARIKLQQVLFDVEFNELERNVSGQCNPQSFVQSIYTPPSPSGSFYTSDIS